MENERKPEEKATPKPVKVKTWKTVSGMNETIPGLGFVVNDAVLKEPFVIKAIEAFENRTGKHIFGTIVVLKD